MFRYLPEQASKVAPSVDWLHNWITDLSVLFTVLICGAMLYFAVVYRKRDGVDHETPRIEGNNFLEIVWTVVPTLICIWVAYYGIVIFQDMREGEQDALVINATGKQWLWEFQYENGKQTIDEFVVPVNKPIKNRSYGDRCFAQLFRSCDAGEEGCNPRSLYIFNVHTG